jgi:hypothetical protein
MAPFGLICLLNGFGFFRAAPAVPNKRTSAFCYLFRLQSDKSLCQRLGHFGFLVSISLQQVNKMTVDKPTILTGVLQVVIKQHFTATCNFLTERASKLLEH